MEPEQIRERPAWLLLSSHWVSLLGVGLLVTSIVSLLIVMASKNRGGDNPYLGILTMGVIPLMFFGGLALVPVGIYLARKQLREKVAATPDEERKAIGMRLAKFFAILTVVNLLIGTQITMKALNHMNSVEFCGATCHSMNLHLAAYGESPHQQVACVECHVAPGFRGFVSSKVNGTRQLWETMTNSFPRPVQSAIETGRMVASNVTCEQCHSSQKFSGVTLRVKPKYLEDETNTETYTVLMNLVGGGYLGGIHGRHFGQGVEISYYAADPSKSTVTWVQYKNTKTGEVREYTADGGKAPTPATKVSMQCVDCHNRPAHTFEKPETAVDRALARGHISASLPYIKKKGVEILRAGYSSTTEADQKIGEAVMAYYKTTYPDVASKQAKEIEAAAKSLRHIYSVNVSPEMKTDWGTYTNQLGHMDFPGCFRCHGGELSTKDGKFINDDCSVCHEMLAVDEKDPEILGKLGLQHRLDELKNRQVH